MQDQLRTLISYLHYRIEDPLSLYPTAGYVNYDDVKMASLTITVICLRAVNSNVKQIPIRDFYVRDSCWLANFKEQWRVYSIKPVGRVTDYELIQITQLRLHLLNLMDYKIRSSSHLSMLLLSQWLLSCNTFNITEIIY